jgi:hypothetical protein
VRHLEAIEPLEQRRRRTADREPPVEQDEVDLRGVRGAPERPSAGW